MTNQLPDMAQIMQLAQKVASQIEPPEAIKNGEKLSEKEMSKVFGDISKSVSEIITPEMFSGSGMGFTSSKKRGKQKVPIKPEMSKITLNEIHESESNVSPKKEKKKKIVEIQSDDSDEDTLAPRTKDMSFTVSVRLEELFSGAKKKIALRRTKIETDGSYQEEKKKLAIKIEPGMIDGQTIRFNHMADEKQGYETGDVVVCLDVEEHPCFTRDGNNLIIEKEISFAETFKPLLYIKHLSGKTLKIKGDAFDVFDDENNLLKKIKGAGMPVLGEPGNYGDLFIKFTCINKTKITEEILKSLVEIFPPIEVKPDIPEEEFQDAEFEMVTDTDLEYLEYDSDSDSDYSDDSETDSETDSENENENENENKNENENEIELK